MGEGFRVTIWKSLSDTPQKHPSKPPKSTPLKKQPPLSNLGIKILGEIKKNPSLTRDLLAKKLDIGSETVKEYIGKLKEAGHLKRVGGRKIGYWEVL
jgi:ATP-dependent DNA helicase RecG